MFSVCVSAVNLSKNGGKKDAFVSLKFDMKEFEEGCAELWMWDHRLGSVGV